MYSLHPTANKDLKEIHCQPDIVVTIVRHFKRTVCSQLILFIILSNDPKLMTEVSNEFHEKISVKFSQNILRNEINGLEAAVGYRYFILRRLSCCIVPPLFEYFFNGSSVSAFLSSDGQKYLSGD